MFMLKNFVKYQSLGNDFIVFDWYKKPNSYMQTELHDASWKNFVITRCNRHFGAGADGVLIITSNPEVGMPEMLIFNADGSQAESCLNGVRSVAHYLFTQHHFPEHFSIKLGTRVIECSIQPGQLGSEPLVTTRVGSVHYQSDKTVDTHVGSFTGSVVTIGNPHFIIFKQVELDWLRQHGKFLESHELFPQKTNVEFVWQNSNGDYVMIVYERACGITLACSSGAAAVIGLLYQQEKIIKNQKIALHMPGGQLLAWVDGDGQIVLQAGAALVYRGAFED